MERAVCWSWYFGESVSGTVGTNRGEEYCRNDVANDEVKSESVMSVQHSCYNNHGVQISNYDVTSRSDYYLKFAARNVALK